MMGPADCLPGGSLGSLEHFPITFSPQAAVLQATRCRAATACTRSRLLAIRAAFFTILVTDLILPVGSWAPTVRQSDRPSQVCPQKISLICARSCGHGMKLTACGNLENWRHSKRAQYGFYRYCATWLAMPAVGYRLFGGTRSRTGRPTESRCTAKWLRRSHPTSAK